MSHHSFIVTNSGPLLETHIGISLPKLQVMSAANQTPPVPVLARMLVDTGASHTSIDQKFVAALGLTPTGSVAVLTPSTGATPHMMPSYDVAFYFVNGHNGGTHTISIQTVTACDLSAQGIDGLIGRDILANTTLTCVGPLGMYHLSF